MPRCGNLLQLSSQAPRTMKTLNQLDLNLLKALAMLLDERNVTRAAQRLGVTQPAMSAMLNRLRDAFGDPLFIRAQRGLVPTPRALELMEPLRQIISDVSTLLQPVRFDPASATQTFTLAATDYALGTLAVPLLAALKQQAPQMRVSLIAVDHQRIQQQLERGEVDLALLTPEIAPPDLHARRLFDEHYVCVMREGHPQAAQLPLTLDRFCQLDHALVSPGGNAFHGVTDAMLAQLGRQRQVTLSVQSFMVLPAILRASDMVAVLPSRLVADLKGLIGCPPPLAIPGFTKIAVWHARSHHDSAQRWLRELLFTLSADQA
ncbi:LysR family transcriptional regulator [Duffyella gerundensis]|nr:LysR family transcriptional regulator [Duffyella gerundensis]